MLIDPCLSPADAPSEDVRKRIGVLVEQTKAEPKNQVPLLHLAKAYGEVWAKSNDPKVVLRAMQCIERAIELETGWHGTHIRQLLSGLGKHAQAKGQLRVVERCKLLSERLDGKAKRMPHSSRSPDAPREAPASAKPGPEIESPQTSAKTESAAATADTPNSPSAAEAKAPPGPESGAGEGPDEERQSGGVATARQIARVKQLFEAGSVGEILSAYAGITEPQVRRRIIDKLIERLDQFKIDPLLAIGAIENDKQTFRFMIRQLLAGDRSLVAKQIDLAKYSPDLRQVAVAVLAELRLRSALPKLMQALDIDDPLVRCVAAHGIARLGRGAESQIPVLVETARADPDPYVREAGAKALESMNMIEAFDALETVSREAKLDASVMRVLDQMREKFDPDGSRAAQIAALARKGGGEKPTAEGETRKPEKIKKPVDPKIKAKRKKALIVAISVAVGVAAIGFFLYKQLPSILSMMKVVFSSPS